VSWHERFLGDPDEWRTDLTASALALAGDDLAMLVIDPLADLVLAATPALTRLVGPLPDRASGLVERGLLARPDLAAITDHLDAWRRLDDIEGEGRETMHSWSADLRVHTDDGSRAMSVDILHHRRPLIGAEAVVATLHEQVDAAVGTARTSVVDTRFWLVYDHQMRIVAADPRMTRIGIDPKAQVGLVAALTVHPDDLPAAMPKVLGVIAERSDVADFVVRIRGDRGWVRVQVELRRLLAPEGPLLIGLVQVAQTVRRNVPDGVLSGRETAIVAGLHDGLRVAMIADRDHVSVKTVRNQLAAIYRKLGVTGQEELLRTFSRPGH
jgi:DNA-binding CsgD family transcriptional regulator